MHDKTNHPWLSPTGFARLEYVADWLEGEKPPLNGVGQFNIQRGVEFVPECGTVCCIAGALVQFFEPYKLEEAKEMAGYDRVGIPWQNVKRRAAALLGIDPEKEILDYLFKSGWESVPYHIMPAHAACTLRKFLRTGKVDWDEYINLQNKVG